MTALKAEELRLGNYFMFGAMRHRCSYHDIANLCKAEAKGQVIELYQPIPLTEQWLLKFGSKKEFLGFQFLIDERRTLEIAVNTDRAGLWYAYLREIDGNEVDLVLLRRELEFVHTLQNIWHSLTRTELTIIESNSLTVENKKG